MADEVKKKLTEDGESTWSNFTTVGPYFYPRGAIGKWFARFFATPAQAEVAKKINDIETPDLGGDTKVKSSDVDKGGLTFSVNRASPVYSEIERGR